MPSTTQNGRPGNRSASTSSIETNNSTPVSRKTSQPLLRRNDPEVRQFLYIYIYIYIFYIQVTCQANQSIEVTQVIESID